MFTKSFIWLLFRALFAVIIVTPLCYVAFVLIASAPPRYLAINWDAYFWLTVFLALIGYVLTRRQPTREVGKLWLVSILGVSVMVMYEGQGYHIGDQYFSAYSLFVGFLFVVSTLYFVVPSPWLRPFLFLLPVSALTWFLRTSIYQPIYFSYEVYINRAKFTPEQLTHTIELLQEQYLIMFIGGSMAVGLLIPYYFALYGWRPMVVYKNLRHKRFPPFKKQ